MGARWNFRSRAEQKLFNRNLIVSWQEESESFLVREHNVSSKSPWYFFAVAGALVGFRLSFNQGHNVYRALPDGLLGVALGLIIRFLFSL